MHIIRGKWFGDLERWQRNLYVLWLAQFIAMAGMSACVPFLPIFIKELGVSDKALAQQWSGFVFSGPFLVSFLTTPFWSALGDRFSRKLLVLRAVIGLSISMVCMGYSHSVEELLMWRIIQGAVSGFVAANLSFVSAETPSENVGYAIGVMQTSQNAGAILGPFIGGALSHAVGMRPVFWIVGGLASVSAALVALFVLETHSASTKVSSSSVRSNLVYAFRQKDILLILALMVVSQMSIVFTTPLFPYYLEELGTSADWLSLATGAFVGIVGVNSLIFTPRWGRRNDKKGYRKTIKVTAAVVGIVTIIQAFAVDALTLLILRFVIGVFIGGVVPSLSTALSKISPKEIRGGIMGFAASAMLLGNLLSPPVSGMISPYIGIRWCFAIAGILMLVVSVASMFLRDVVVEQREREVVIQQHEIEE
ncbi:MAG: MFS transporter [Candidatus Kapabacteria bacterium]|nr:MFS transporter [Candidatus Kapabacteria bacterium]